MNNLDIEMLLKVLNGSAKSFREFGCDVGETITLNNYITNLQLENERLKNIINGLDNYIESEEFDNIFHCCEEKSKVKKDIRNILEGNDKE